MSCEQHSKNATGPAPAVAPGAEAIGVAAFAASYETDPRLAQIVPGFDAPFFQAGLAGYSDAAMRIVARRHGCPYCVTEALLDRTILAGGRGFAKADLGDIHDNVPHGAEDHPLAGQIMGSDPGEMAAAAVKMVEQASRTDKTYRTLGVKGLGAAPDSAPPVREAAVSFETIDVNLACPVKKIKSKARGGHWLRDPDGALAILKAVRDAVPESIPCSVKLRRGSDDSQEAERNFYKIFDGLYDLGYCWATVHGRTVEQKYVGPSRWTFLRELVQKRPGRIVFGSGDVWDAAEVFRMLAYTSVHAAAVARGCIGNPWLFRQARDLMAGRTPKPPTLEEQREVLRQHFELSVAVNGERAAGLLMRKFGIKFAQHHPSPAEVKARFVRVSTLDEWRAVVDEWYEPAPAGAEPTAADSF